MGWWRRPARIVRDLEATGLLLASSMASALLLLPRGDDGLMGLPELAEGQVAPRTVKSSRAFSTPDPELTQETRDRARARVRPVFDHLLGVSKAAKSKVQNAFQAIETVLGQKRIEIFRVRLGLELDKRLVQTLLATERKVVTLDAISMLIEALYQRQTISDPGLLRPQEAITIRAIDSGGQVTSERIVPVGQTKTILGPVQARALIDALVAERLTHLSPRLQLSVAELTKGLIKPNLVSNAQETLRRRRMAWLSVKPTVIQVHRGDKILRAGERISKRDFLLLDALETLESPQARLLSALGSGLVGALLGWFAYRAARYGYRHRRPRQKDLVFLACVFVAHLLIGWLGFKVVEWLADIQVVPGLPVLAYRLILPLSAATIVTRLAAGPIVATATVPVVGLLAGWMMDGDLDYAAYALVGALSAASIDSGAKRMVLNAGLSAGLAQAAMVVGTSLLASQFDIRWIVSSAVLALVSGLLSGLLARSVLPAVEALFEYTTPTGLASFADAEHPLMRELLVEVPGTYHHSLQVGVLAEAGAKAIGSDRLLARVGGYLHDVGRIRGQREPELRRKTAAKLAKEHRFPAELTQILVEQPHEHSSGKQVDRRVKPRSKTSALVVLADRVDSALAGREGQFQDIESLELVVRDEIRSAVSARILDEAALELRELAAVSQAFTAALKTRFVFEESGPQPQLRLGTPSAPSS